MKPGKFVAVMAVPLLALTACSGGSTLESPDDAYVKLTQAGHPCEFEGFGESGVWNSYLHI